MKVNQMPTIVIPMESFGEYIAKLRMESGRSQRDLAKKAHISSAALSKIESGISEKLRVETLVALAGALGVKAGDLLMAYQGYEPGTQSATVDEDFSRDLLRYIKENIPREKVREASKEEKKG